MGEALSPSGPRKERMENSLTPRPPRGPGWGADSRTRGGRGPPSPPAAGRRGRPKRRGLERTWAQVVGARQRREGAGGSPARARDPRQLHRSGAQGFAAVCRPPWGCPVHVASLGAGGPGPAAAAASCSLLLRLLLLLPGLLHSPPPAAPLAGSQSPPPGARGAGGKRLPPAGVQQGWAEARQGCGAVGRALDRGACAATALQRRPRPPRSRARAPPPPHRAERQARVNELDFGYLERGGLPCTLSTRAHRHTHTPPPKSGFPQGMGGEEVVAKAVQTMERGKVSARGSASAQLGAAGAQKGTRLPQPQGKAAPASSCAVGVLRGSPLPPLSSFPLFLSLNFFPQLSPLSLSLPLLPTVPPSPPP